MKKVQVIWRFTEVEWDEEEGCLTVYPNWRLGFHRAKGDMLYIYKWALYLGWVEVRAWQYKGYAKGKKSLTKGYK